MSAPCYPEQGSFSFAPAEILDPNIFRSLSTVSLLVSHSRWVQPKKHGRGMMLARPNRLLSSVLSTLGQCFIPPQPVLSRPHTQTRMVLFLSLQISIPNLVGTFSQLYFKKMFSNCLFLNSPAKGWPYRFRSRGTTGSSILDHDFGHLSRGRRIQMSGHSDFGIFNNLRASSIFIWV